MRQYIIQETRRAGYYGVYFLIVPDNAAGLPGRYTVYRVPSSPRRRIRVVGRELPLGFARKHVARLMEKERKSHQQKQKRMREQQAVLAASRDHEMKLLDRQMKLLAKKLRSRKGGR